MSSIATARSSDSPRRPVVARNDAGWMTRTLWRIRAEYEDMPGLCLTSAQAQRLWGLDPDTCDTMLKTLVEVGYLRYSTGQRYVRN
jgi:hypothetical protein